MSTDTMYMDNLDEFVNDENKVVTYKWLSQTLQVHVNQAKQMLYAFVEDQRNKKDNDSIHVTYFVAGMVKSLTGQDKSLKCAVVPEEELEAVKASMDPVTSCHIFSVQKVQLKDSSPLYITDYSALRENVLETSKFSSISFKKAKPRSKEQLEKLGGKSHTKKEPASSSGKTSAASSSSSSSSSSHGSKTAPKGGIASLFANLGASKKDEGSKTEAGSSATHAAVTKETSKSHSGASGPKSKKVAGGVMSFFSNHTGRANKPVEKTSPPAEEKSVEPSTSSAKQKASVSKKTEVKKPSRTHKLSDSDEESKSQKKKRRRIQTISDSSSSSEEEMDIEESPVPSPAPSPPVLEAEEAVAMATKEEPAEEEDEDVIPSTPQNGVKHKHVRRRKLVPKTYMDSDGFMVTEKVMESESASEVEEEPKPTSPAKPPAAAQKTNHNASKKDPPPKKASPKKKTTPTAGNKKQMSLTSFFSKK